VITTSTSTPSAANLGGSEKANSPIGFVRATRRNRRHRPATTRRQHREHHLEDSRQALSTISSADNGPTKSPDGTAIVAFRLAPAESRLAT
jgi:hypothetical protein